MYYYKHLNESGEISQLESRNMKINNASELTVEITKEEYEVLLAEMLKDIDEPAEDEISPAEALKIIVGGAKE